MNMNAEGISSRTSSLSKSGNPLNARSPVIVWKALLADGAYAFPQQGTLQLAHELPQIYLQIKNVIGVNPSFYEYLFMADAGTVVDTLSLNR